jgi:competence protein ComFC
VAHPISDWKFRRQKESTKVNLNFTMEQRAKSGQGGDYEGRGLGRLFFDRFFPQVMGIIYPCDCTLCGKEIPKASNVLCSSCWEELREGFCVEVCPTCGLPVGAYEVIEGRCHRCKGRHLVVSSLAAPGRYAGAMRELILLFKYYKCPALAKFLGSVLASFMLGKGHTQDIDLIIPIPLHWRRRLSRGYNQSELLSRAVAAEMKRHGIRVPVSDSMVRIRNTRPQVTLPPSKRRNNLRGAFVLRPGSDVRGLHVCLIDDVTTTGSTLKEAAKALRRCGARQVSAVVLAIAAKD